MDVLFGPRHFGNVDQAFDARLQFDERAVVGDVGHAAGELGAHRILGLDAFPRIGLELLHAQADAVALVVDADDLDLDGLADRQHFRRMVDTAPGDVGDVQQAVDAAEVNERTVIGDVLDHAVDDLAFLELLDDFGALLSTALFEDRTARHDDVAAALVHLQDLERLRHIHQRADVADRTDVHLRTRQERHGAFEVDGEAALDLVEDDAFNALVLVVHLFELDPALFAAGLLTRQHGLAHRVLDAIDIDLDLGTDLDGPVTAGLAEFLEGDAAFGLETDVDDREILLDRDDLALNNGAFHRLVFHERVHQEGFEVFLHCSLRVSQTHLQCDRSLG